MFLTVAICTWNRASMLDLALNALGEMQVPEAVEWELLVVDNNSTDETGEVIEAHANVLPVRGLFEPQQGKSFALNRAIEESRGDYILWTDDDALVDADWMRAYFDAFARWPDAGVFGGPIRPWFTNTPPAWLQRALPVVQVAYAVISADEPDQPLTGKLVPYGVNMAVRREEQTEYGYDTRLGPRPSRHLRGEETDLVRRMLSDGIEGRWVSGAIVDHHVPESRQSLEYLRSYFRGVGEAQAVTGTESGPGLLGRPRWLWRKVLESEIDYRFKRVFSDPRVWAEAMVVASIARGQLSGSFSDVR